MTVREVARKRFADLTYADLDAGWLMVNAVRDRSGYRSQLWNKHGEVVFLCDHEHRTLREARECGTAERPKVSREMRYGS